MKIVKHVPNPAKDEPIIAEFSSREELEHISWVKIWKKSGHVLRLDLRGNRFLWAFNEQDRSWAGIGRFSDCTDKQLLSLGIAKAVLPPSESEKGAKIYTAAERAEFAKKRGVPSL